MKIQFKPMLWPSIFSILIFAILISFGTWQVKRLFWKEALIENYIIQSQSNPITDPVELEKSSINEFKSIGILGRFMHSNEIYITGKTYEGNAGFHVITPFIMENNKIVLINRGWVSESYKNPDKRKFSLTKGLVKLKGIIRYPQKKGYFVPENDGENGPRQINMKFNILLKTSFICCCAIFIFADVFNFRLYDGMGQLTW